MTTATLKHDLDKAFFLGGKAFFTVEPPIGWIQTTATTQSHYTYLIRRSRDGRKYFVNSMRYETREGCVGVLDPQTGDVIRTFRSDFLMDDWRVKIVTRVLKAVWEGRARDLEASDWQLHHEGKCCRCGRRLTVPASIQTGIGPECESFVRLGVGPAEEVPCTTNVQIAKLQYSYWAAGDKVALVAIVDAAQEAGWEPTKAEALARATKATMRRFKGGKALPQAFKRILGVY